MSDRPALATINMTIGTDVFLAKLRQDLSPYSCERLQELMPYCGEIIHARWSGECLWSPLGSSWPSRLVLPQESSSGQPAPGEVLLFAGTESEPELLIPYGLARFASKSGPLLGNHVLTIDDPYRRLAELGHQILWRGAQSLRIE